MPKNYYIILGLAPGATPREIKEAYRQLAKEYHPDRYEADTQPFMDVQEAYAVLGDAARRRAYDRLLGGSRAYPTRRESAAEPLVGEPSGVEPLVPHRGSGGPEEVSLTRSFATFSPSFDEIFDRLWSNFASLAHPKAERVEGLRVEIPLLRSQAARGGHVRVLVPARATCPTCRGRGGVGFYECWRCAGEGAITGELPLLVAFPRGLACDHQVQIPLDRFGIRNLYLTVHFRVTGGFGLRW
jgi:molecular chaperone DnaJ